jgi:hypothetical protein
LLQCIAYNISRLLAVIKGAGNVGLPVADKRHMSLCFLRAKVFAWFAK